MSLGSNIYQLRKQANLSQEELASRCQVTRQAISRWELDEVMPDTNNLISLSNVFQVTIDELINHKIEPQEQPKQPEGQAKYIFDKSVQFVSKHWAKYGYYLVFTSIPLLLFGFAIMNMHHSFFGPLSEGIGLPALPAVFSIISFLPLLLGLFALIVGIGLIIYDHEKNKKA